VNVVAAGYVYVCVYICARTHAHIRTEFKSDLNHCLATLIFICGGKLGMFASLFQYLPTDGSLLIVVKRNTNALSPVVLCKN
jgi:hypothetical protein